MSYVRRVSIQLTFLNNLNAKWFIVGSESAAAKTTPPQSHPKPQSSPSAYLPHQPHDAKCRCLRECVNGFINDLNSGAPTITIKNLSDGISSFSYLGIKFTLEVPEEDNIFTLQTEFEHNKKAAGISARIVEWNKALQEIGLGGKLTFRSIKGKFTFMLSRDIDPDKFSRRELRHSIEYFLEMSIKLHNIINVNDLKKICKVRLANNVGVVSQ